MILINILHLYEIYLKKRIHCFIISTFVIEKKWLLLKNNKAKETTKQFL
jgi:hypothetical protein